MKPTWILLAFVALAASQASAQECGDCPDAKPVCPQYQEPTCNGGEWVCPDPICEPQDRRICEEEWCGIWDERTCTCDVEPGGCGGCDPHERDRCYQECNYSDRCWDEQLCYCWPYRDVTGPGPQSRARRAPGGRQRVFLGHFPAARRRCEQIPTSLAADWSVPTRIHSGDAVIGPYGDVVSSHAWGVSRPLQWAVLDQNGDLIDNSDMLAYEYVDTLSAHPWTGSEHFEFGVQTNRGVFGDLYAWFTEQPPGLGPNDFKKRRQRIVIRWKHHEWEVLNQCVRFTPTDISPIGCGQ